MESEIILRENEINEKIHTIRGLQVMLDSDLAELYNVETKNLNKAVKRNIDRFPSNFMFQLSVDEYNFLKSQFVISSKDSLRSQPIIIKNMSDLRFQNATSSSIHGGRRYIPYVFTEQGVAMLSGVLKSDTAVKVSINIINAFVSMRKFISSNAQIFQRLDFVDKKLIEHDTKFENIFQAIEDKDLKPDKGIFFDGQIFDAYKFVSDLIRSAKDSIILVDNYIDDSVLTFFTKRNKNVDVVIFTKNITKQLCFDLERYNSQYPKITIKEFHESHDRFLIIDNKEVYHIGASLKDLGKKWFGFSKHKEINFLCAENIFVFSCV